MGRSYSFECPKCGYRTKVAGGTDRGFDFAVQTIVCRDCKHLYDAVVRMKIPNILMETKMFLGFPRLRHASDGPPTFEAAISRLPMPGARSFRWTQFKIRCPVSHTHRVQLWNAPGKCPRCGVFLDKNPLPFRIWD